MRPDRFRIDFLRLPGTYSRMWKRSRAVPLETRATRTRVCRGRAPLPRRRAFYEWGDHPPGRPVYASQNVVI